MDNSYSSLEDDEEILEEEEEDGDEAILLSSDTEDKGVQQMHWDCRSFFSSCNIEEYPVTLLEQMTFRIVKEFWLKKKEREMTSREKVCLKPMWVQLVQRLLEIGYFIWRSEYKYDINLVLLTNINWHSQRNCTRRIC